MKILSETNWISKYKKALDLEIIIFWFKEYLIFIAIFYGISTSYIVALFLKH